MAGKAYIRSQGTLSNPSAKERFYACYAGLRTPWIYSPREDLPVDTFDLFADLGRMEYTLRSITSILY